MKKFNFTKIVSLALVCAMLMGAFMFTTFAADEATVEIVAKNVWYGEKYQLMFAYNAPAGATVSATVNGKPVAIETYELTEEDEVDADYACMVSEGVAAQAIDTVVTFTVAYGEEETATVNYSVLQYLYERMYVSETNKAEGAELAMFEALLAYADAASIFFNTTDDDETNNDKNIADLVYVNATDCTFDGKTAGMVKAGETVYFETEVEAEAGYVVKFEITDLASGDVIKKIDVETMASEGYKVTSSVSVKAIVEESTDNKVVEHLATFELGNATSDSNTAISSYTEQDGNYTLSITGAEKMYKGYDTTNKQSGLKFGSGSAKGKCTINVDANVTKVVIYVCKYSSDSTKITVAGKQYTLTSAYQAITVEQPNEGVDWTISVAAATNSKQRFYINTIEFHGYAE